VAPLFLSPLCAYPGVVTVSGKSGEDSKLYQEKQVRRAIEEVKK